MLKRAVIAAACLAISSTASFSAYTVNWGASTSGSYLYDSTGAALSTGGLLIQLVYDIGGNTDHNSMITSAEVALTGDVGFGIVNATATDDVVVDTFTWSYYAGAGYFYTAGSSTYDGPENATDFYVRWFNSSSLGTATEAGIIYSDGSSQVWTSPDDDPVTSTPGPPVSANFTYGVVSGVTGSEYTGGSNNGWATIAAVPEPGMIGLLAVGVATLVARRKRKA
jgi:hypothetical protein